MAIRKNVTLNVNKDFYDKFLQVERIKFSKMLGVNLSNTKFTEYLAKNRVQFKMPKIKSSILIPKRGRKIWSI